MLACSILGALCVEAMKWTWVKRVKKLRKGDEFLKASLIIGNLAHFIGFHAECWVL